MKKIFQKINDRLKGLGLFFKKKTPPQAPDNADQTPSLPEEPVGEEKSSLPKTKKFAFKKVSLGNIKDRLNGLKKVLKPGSKSSNVTSSKFWQTAVQKTQGLRNKLMKTKGGAKFFTWFNSIQWRKLSSNFLSPVNRPIIHKGFLTLTALLFAYNMGKTVGHFLKGDSDLKPATKITTLPAYFPNSVGAHNRIFSRNIFDLKDSSMESKTPKLADKKIKKKLGPCLQASGNSSLGFKLLDTTVLQDSVKSIASIQVRGGGEIVHIREGEKINNLAKVGRIGRLEVIFRNLKNEKCERVVSKEANLKSISKLNVVSPERGKRLMTRKTKSGVKNNGNKFVIPKKALDEKLKNINKVLTEAKALKIDNGDGTLSFKMTKIVPGSIYTELGFQNGDIIKAINGAKIKNVNEVFNLFGNIRSMKDLELKISRNGQDSNFQYKIGQ